ncbi:MAG: hypothetical protein ACO2ZC_07095, partial [Pseudomonadales bacterium]
MFVEKGDGPGGAAALGIAGEERGEVIGMVEIQGQARARHGAESKPLALGLLAAFDAATSSDLQYLWDQVVAAGELVWLFDHRDLKVEEGEDEDRFTLAL